MGDLSAILQMTKSWPFVQGLSAVRGSEEARAQGF